MSTVITDRASSAEAVLQRHVAAFAKHDLDALMADYGDDAVFVTPQGVYDGRVAIRNLFEGLIAEFSAPQTRLSLHQQQAAGPLVLVTWTAETARNRYEFATDTLFVADGLIRWQTFAAVIKPK